MRVKWPVYDGLFKVTNLNYIRTLSIAVVCPVNMSFTAESWCITF